MTARIGLIGGRGHTGREILRLLARRDDMELVVASSRELEGQPVRDTAPEFDTDLRFESLDPAQMKSRDLDAIILALPNGVSQTYLPHIPDETIIVDLSADGRFDPAWTYGLPEIYGREAVRTARRIANPGCYATCGQLAIAPVRDRLAGPVHVFGVSGYSGAGMTPSRKNDLAALKDNLIPYALSGHIHEREMSHHLGAYVRFSPHVAPFFRGLMTTVHLTLANPLDAENICGIYADFYRDESLIEICEDAPEPAAVAAFPGARIGGFSIADDGRALVVVSVLDNLLKGAAVQAMQNLSLALGLPERTLDMMSNAMGENR
jgi:N-acetyl-gamma-glutamyl-phosphate reductase